MTLRNWLEQMIQFLVLIPSAVICYLPMHRQMQFTVRKTALLVGAALCVYIPAASWCTAALSLECNFVLLPSLILFCIGYRYTIKTDWSRCICAFLLSCVVSAFISNFSFTFDAWLHPDSTSSQFSWQAALFQLAVTCAAALLLVFPLHKWGSILIDRLIVPGAWSSMIAVSVVYLLLNLAIIPRRYSTLYVGRCFPIYLAILAVLLMFLISMYVSFYHTAMGILSISDIKERIQFFEMAENQYRMQKKYIEDTAKARHDFKQSVFTLKQLADEGDLTAVQEYLKKYVSALPETEIIYFCKNHAVNALLNYYAQLAEQNGIELDWHTDIPETISVSEPDMCSILGNLIENAFAGCATLGEGVRKYHCLSVEVKNNANLYIVSTNSFDGFVRMRGGNYESTKRKGSGIGIHSVKMVAEKYHGTAMFHHTESEFFADVMIRIK